MKKIIFAVVALVLFSSFAFGQWEYVKDFAKKMLRDPVFGRSG